MKCSKRVKYIGKNSFGRNNKGLITVRGKQNFFSYKSNRIIKDNNYMLLYNVRRFLLFFNSIRVKILSKKVNLLGNNYLYFVSFLNGPLKGCNSYCSISKNVFINSIIRIGGNNYNELIYPGDIVNVRYVLEGSKIYNISNAFSSVFVYAKNSVKNARLIYSGLKYVLIKLPSGGVKLFNKYVYCTYGELEYCLFKKIKKAGDKRLLGVRPKVRGVAMNACDHPHGGGEGKNSIGRSSVFSIWGKKCKGVRTRKI